MEWIASGEWKPKIKHTKVLANFIAFEVISVAFWSALFYLDVLLGNNPSISWWAIAIISGIMYLGGHDALSTYRITYTVNEIKKTDWLGFIPLRDEIPWSSIDKARILIRGKNVKLMLTLGKPYTLSHDTLIIRLSDYKTPILVFQELSQYIPVKIDSPDEAVDLMLSLEGTIF